MRDEIKQYTKINRVTLTTKGIELFYTIFTLETAINLDL